MRLKSIKLAGFKSFVDPTTTNFPENLTAVVGPNGCGKSNIIDAVRWVMGESSAKHLRGESMADVIFNGSNARKPVAQASIELIFDNSDATVTGEYGKFNEISVKRQVTRDGQSNYFLNGTKCRRKDIADIFLGTGLGPRSYAIIEQGMISRLIEAKPEELRVYIEEAAGISKYKAAARPRTASAAPGKTWSVSPISVTSWSVSWNASAARPAPRKSTSNTRKRSASRVPSSRPCAGKAWIVRSSSSTS